MHLFIAITVPLTWKDHMQRAVNYLREHSPSCVPIQRENFHLTLDFLGELDHDNVPAISAAMDSVRHPDFYIQSAGVRCTHYDDGDMWWLDVAPNPDLTELQAELTAALRSAGFEPENEEFTPHLTLARRVQADADFDPAELERLLPPMEIYITYTTLLNSELIHDRLYYTPLHRSSLPLNPNR